MSSTMPRGGLRMCTRSIHWPDKSVSAARLLAVASHCVAKRPIWLGEAAQPCAAPSNATHRTGGSPCTTAVRAFDDLKKALQDIGD
jgi:hypothetical protein